MSLILEALRKSEAERRRGQAPGLFTPEASVLMPAAREKSQVLLIGIVVLLMIAIAYGGWRWLQDDAVTVAAPTVAAVDTPPVTETTAPVTAVPAATNPTETDTPPAGMITAMPPSSTGTTAAPIQATTPPTRIAAPPAARPMPPPAAPIAAPASQAGTASEPPAITLAALSSERRSQLPPLKLSMHVYADDTAKRFAIIDGQRITEGSALGDAVVRAIRRDGVLLDIDGSSYLLPRP